MRNVAPNRTGDDGDIVASAGEIRGDTAAEGAAAARDHHMESAFRARRPGEAREAGEVLVGVGGEPAADQAVVERSRRSVDGDGLHHLGATVDRDEVPPERRGGGSMILRDRQGPNGLERGDAHGRGEPAAYPVARHSRGPVEFRAERSRSGGRHGFDEGLPIRQPPEIGDDLPDRLGRKCDESPHTMLCPHIVDASSRSQRINALNRRSFSHCEMPRGAQ
ncbi:hypothetical protein TPAU25S_03372 [Tsukamurella paurometabola]|nr:Uncharacterised protein [Tsukamurella paurometabola]